MTSPIIINLEKLLGGPRDNALLRYSLGNEWLKCGDAAKACVFLRTALDLDPAYSAAWKGYGKALQESGDLTGALDAFTRGAQVAQSRGDLQAAKEMSVFIRRLQKGSHQT